jgi:nucleoside-diphosphate kinase
MKESVLVIIKPDGMRKNLAGAVLERFGRLELEMIGLKLVEPDRNLLEEHYRHLKGQPFFEKNIRFMLGDREAKKSLIAIVYCGAEAVKKCRAAAGATNPEAAEPLSIRGSYGRITTDGVFENVVHVSSDPEEARREISLWFGTQELLTKI